MPTIDTGIGSRIHNLQSIECRPAIPVSYLGYIAETSHIAILRKANTIINRGRRAQLPNMNTNCDTDITYYYEVVVFIQKIQWNYTYYILR